MPRHWRRSHHEHVTAHEGRAFYMGISFRAKGCAIRTGQTGAERYSKVSYPQRYGCYTELETPETWYHFNPEAEIVYARGKGASWPNPQEWLKRTIGDDWVYYSTGGYTGVFEAIGEYYLPNLQYPTNALMGGAPFNRDEVRRIITGWHAELVRTCEMLASSSDPLPEEISIFMERARGKSPAVLAAKARRLFAISGGRATVLPPDARHVDYDLLPLTIGTGCLYKCRFCRVKNNRPFSELPHQEVVRQLTEIRELYGDALSNYNSLFLGEHDALCCRREAILSAIGEAVTVLGLADSFMRGVNVFLFGSVDSFLAAERRLFDELGRLPAQVYINLGLESFDQETLDQVGKPVTAARVRQAFSRMQDINDSFVNIEVSANVLMDDDLPRGHLPALMEMIRDAMPRKKPKGTIYCSPLRFARPSRELVYDFRRLKLNSRLPTYLYIIQRL